MTDQIAEYRRLMEDRFTELNDSKRAEEETRKAQEMLKVDEEIAKKLQEQYSRPPVYFPVREAVPQGDTQEPVMSRTGCLPEVEDKCCGVNTQKYILAAFGVTTIGLLILFIVIVA